jgi:hypothetical protein
MFEPVSRLSAIRYGAFASCSALSSIAIPSSVETLAECCFAECQSLRTVTFESGSNLSTVEPQVFPLCPSISSICIPASLRAVFREYQGILNIIPGEPNGVCATETAAHND